MIKNIASQLLKISFINTLLKRMAIRSERAYIFSIVIGNIFPVIGSGFLGWEVVDLLLFFWIENIIIGIFHSFKFLFTKEDRPSNFTGRIREILQFIFLYGFASTIHGLFVGFIYILLKDDFLKDKPSVDLQIIISSVITSSIIQGYIFLRFFLLNKEYKKVSGEEIMMQPFLRAFVVHMTIIIVLSIFGILPVASLNYLTTSIKNSTLLNLIHFILLVFNIIFTTILCLLKTYIDLQVYFNADKLGPYTTKMQKQKAKIQKQKALYRKIMREKKENEATSS